MKLTSKVLTTKDNEEWDKLIDSVPNADVYYSAGYHKIYEQSYSKDIDESFNGKAFLFFYGDEESCVIFPFFKRKIEVPYVSGEFFDITTVYGYSGPIIKCSKNKDKLIEGFLDSLNKYCLENNIVSGFIRFHPLINNYLDFKDHVKLIDERDTIYIDLEKNLDIIFKEFNKKTRNQTRKSEKSGVVVYKSESEDDLKDFANLYLRRMEYNKTTKKYFFPFEFYKNTKEFLGEDISLFVAKYKDKIISSSLFIHRNNYVHYHFSGSNEEFWNLSASNLVLWEAMKYFKEKGYKKFLLGAGNSKGDSLYHFKYGFSKDRSLFRAGGMIFDNRLYEKLVDLRKKYCEENKIEFNDSFFPAYRGYVSSNVKVTS